MARIVIRVTRLLLFFSLLFYTPVLGYVPFSPAEKVSLPPGVHTRHEPSATLNQDEVLPTPWMYSKKPGAWWSKAQFLAS